MQQHFFQHLSAGQSCCQVIDIWSAACVSAELILGHPMFPGESGVDQLVEIIKVLGTPTREELMAMNPNYTECLGSTKTLVFFFFWGGGSPEVHVWGKTFINSYSWEKYWDIEKIWT